MSLLDLRRLVLRLFLAAALVLPGIAAPAQAVAQEIASAASGGREVVHSPCDAMGMTMPDTSHSQTPAHGCDLSVCLGAGCLPAIPHVAAFIPEADSLIEWDQQARLSWAVDTPIRPPIA